MNSSHFIHPSSLSIIVPLYNEEDTIAENTTKLNHYFSKLSPLSAYEIILVESGSTDHSPEICDKLAQSLPNVKVIHEGKKNGYGSGIRTGLKQAQYEILTYVDSDSPCDLSHYARALEMLQNTGCDAVLGYKLGKRESFSRWFFSKEYNWLTKLIFGLWNIKDVNFTFKLFRKEIYDQIQLHSNGWFIDVELLSELKKQRPKIKIGQIPIEYIHRQKGKSNVTINFKLIKGFLKEMWDYKFRKR
ncbi:MAG: glycosyltransferase family 2 protein [Nanoarchaeota archaeon]